MQKIILYLCFLFIPANNSSTRNTVQTVMSKSVLSECQMLYKDLHLENIVDFTAFQQAFTGYNTIDRRNKDILTLIDFTKPSTTERLFVLNIKQKKLLFSSLVSHGKNSGVNYATSFSNVMNSYKSSLGFYITENTYTGKNGYSLILNGVEKSINDRAKERAIVIHGAPYSNPSVIASSGRLGRSFGCPALPQAVNKPIINTIKDGTLLFIYANDKDYPSQSPVLSAYNNI